MTFIRVRACRSRLVTHGAFGSGEHVAPQDFTLGKGCVKMIKQFLRSRGEEGGVRARVVLGRDQLARSIKGHAKVLDHGGDQGARHDATGHEGRQGHVTGRAKAKSAAGNPCGSLPARVIQRSPQREAMTKARRYPSKKASKSRSKTSPLMRTWYIKLGHIGTLSGKHGGVA